MKSISMTTSRIAAALPWLVAFIFRAGLAWLAMNLADMLAFNGTGRAFLGNVSINGFQAVAVLCVGAVLGWAFGWRDSQRRREA